MAFLDRLLGPHWREANPPRCEWRTPLGQEQCTLDAGHRGYCVTPGALITSRRTGKSHRAPEHTWYGINFMVD